MRKMLVLLLNFISVTVFSQTVEEVIQKNSAAMGGLEAFKKVNTAKITGTLTSQEQTLPLTMQMINGKSVRTDVEVNGQTVTNVYHKGTGWKINPYAGAPTATAATPAELVNLKAQASLANNLMDYKNRGHQVELLGQEEVDGANSFKIKLTNKDDNKVTTYFINASNYLLVKSVAKREIAGNEYDAESFYSDFKDVNGLKFCMKFYQKIDGKILQDVKYTSVELNVPVDEKIFAMPK